jgi:hypothetical protein
MKDYTKDELFQMTQELGMGAFPFNTIADVHTSERLAFRTCSRGCASNSRNLSLPRPAYHLRGAADIHRRAPCSASTT